MSDVQLRCESCGATITVSTSGRPNIKFEPITCDGELRAGKIHSIWGTWVESPDAQTDAQPPTEKPG